MCDGVSSWTLADEFFIRSRNLSQIFPEHTRHCPGDAGFGISSGGMHIKTAHGNILSHVNSIVDLLTINRIAAYNQPWRPLVIASMAAALNGAPLLAALSPKFNLRIGLTPMLRDLDRGLTNSFVFLVPVA